MGWFVWNGVDSRTMGLVITEPAPLILPSERVETVSVPGRSGFLTRTEGEQIYDGYLKTVGIGNRRTADPRAVAAWLRGSGELVLSSEPDFVYYGRIIKEATLSRIFGGVYSGPVSWMVQPGKGRIPAEADTVWTSSSAGFPTLWNPGDLAAAPLITVSCVLANAGEGLRLQLGIGPEAVGVNNDVPRIDIDLRERGDIAGFVFDASVCRAVTLDGSEILDPYVTLWHSADGVLKMPARETSVVSWLAEGCQVTGVTVRPRWRWL